MPRVAWSLNSIAQVTMIGLCGGQQIVTRHAFMATDAKEATLTTDALAQAWATALALDWRTTMQATFLGCLPNDYNLTLVRDQVIERPGFLDHRLASHDDVSTLPAAGGVGTGAGALNACGVLRWKTGVSGRSERGRTYFLAGGGKITGGLLITGFAASLAAYGAAMVTRYGAGSTPATGAQLVIYSRPYDNSYYVTRVGGVPNVIHLADYAGFATIVSSSQVDPNGRSQRRRDVGVGS